MAVKPDDPALKSYARVTRLAEHAVGDLRQRVMDAIADLGDPYLVRAQMDKPRIKTHESLARKAKQHGWTLQQAISKAQDLVGLRLVCHNLQD